MFQLFSSVDLSTQYGKDAADLDWNFELRQRSRNWLLPSDSDHWIYGSWSVEFYSRKFLTFSNTERKDYLGIYFQVEIELNEGTAVVQGSTHRLPLTQIVRVYHQNCCQNILMSSNGRCPTLNWRSLTNYLDFIAVLESQANMKFPSNEVSQFWKIECLIHHFPDIFFQDGWKLFFFS